MPCPAEGQAVDGKYHSARLPRPAEIDRLDFAPHHQMRDLPRIGFVAFHGLDQLAIAEHRDPVRQAKDFIHLVGDVKNRDAALPQAGNHAKEPGDLGLGQGGGRLVHDKDFGLERQGLGDLDQLLIAHAQRTHQSARVDVTLQFHEQISRGPFHGAVVEKKEAALLAAKKDIRRGRKRLHQV